MKINNKFWVGLAVITALSVIWVTAEIESYNIDTWGFATGGEIINNYYPTEIAIPNTSLLNGNGYIFDEMCGVMPFFEMPSVGVIGSVSSGSGGPTHPCTKRILAITTSSGRGGTVALTNILNYLPVKANDSFETVFHMPARTNAVLYSWVGYTSGYPGGTLPANAIAINLNTLNSSYLVEVRGIIRNNNVQRNITPTFFLLNTSIGNNASFYKAKIVIINDTFAEFYLYNSTNRFGIGNTNLLWQDNVSGNLPINTTTPRNMSGSIGAFRGTTGITNEPLIEIDYIKQYISGELIR